MKSDVADSARETAIEAARRLTRQQRLEGSVRLMKLVALLNRAGRELRKSERAAR